MAGRFIDPFAGPPGGRVRPWRRLPVAAYVAAVVVLALVVAFLVANRTADVPAPVDPSGVTTSVR